MLQFRVDTMFTVSMFGALSGVIVAVVLQAVATRVPALPAVPRAAYMPLPPGETEPEPLQASRSFRFAVITVLHALALPCCGMPFAGLSAIQMGINVHAIFLLRCAQAEGSRLTHALTIPIHLQQKKVENFYNFFW